MTSRTIYKEEEEKKSSTFHENSTTLTANSIHAERFIPHTKKIQWDCIPVSILVTTPYRDQAITFINQWLNDSSQRRSMFDLCTFNLLQYLPESCHYMQNSFFQSFQPHFNFHLLRNFHVPMNQVYHVIQQNRKQIISIENTLNDITLKNVDETNRQKNIHGQPLQRVLETTPEVIARICDEIQSIMEEQDSSDKSNFSSFVKKAVELRDCLGMVSRDYISKTFFLMDMERLQAMNDLKEYDMYSCRFDSIEIPPPLTLNPTKQNRSCPACQKMKEKVFDYCPYHLFLSLDNRYQNIKSMPMLEKIQGKKKPSIIRTEAQFNQLQHLLKPNGYGNKKNIKDIIVYITIPGIAENRPLVCIGDQVRFRFDSVEVIGIVREVEIKTERAMIFMPFPLTHDKNNLPYLKAIISPKNRKDKSIPEKYKNGGELQRFDVRFGLFGLRAHDILKTTSNYAIMHATDRLERVITPTPFLENISKTFERRKGIAISKWKHQNLNLEQKQAVHDIMCGNHGQAPYCIYGPPGTGKTVTVVESIIQILRQDKTKKILVCAPSDAACDVVAKRLLHSLPLSCEMLRVNWVSRNPASLPIELYSCSSVDDSGFFKLPSTQRLQEVSVIICQCFVAGCLELETELKSDPWMSTHFTHCFIDESSQSLEFEALIPLLKVSVDCSIILAGDPKQLGPTVRSNCASRNGLSLSLQERLMGLSLYKEDSNYCVITKLLDNYRSHNALLSVPSQLFYDGNLRCKASTEITSVCENFELLQDGKNFPMMVYDVYDGKEMSKIDTPSFYNLKECYACVRIIEALLESTNVNINQGQIAVITCFRAQVLKLREILRQSKLNSVNVGVVEDFQGQETSVVLVSTVLTENQRRWTEGSMNGLGFMIDPKRFNVAITRAISLCVIVGNLDYLENSGTYWTALIDHVRRNGGIFGDSQDNVEHNDYDFYGMDNFIQKLEELKLLGFGYEVDRYDLAMRGYFEDSPEWKVCL